MIDISAIPSSLQTHHGMHPSLHVSHKVYEESLVSMCHLQSRERVPRVIVRTVIGQHSPPSAPEVNSLLLSLRHVAEHLTHLLGLGSFFPPGPLAGVDQV